MLIIQLMLLTLVFRKSVSRWENSRVGWGHNAVRLVEGCYLQAEGSARRPKFTELLLSTTSVKIGSLPWLGPATVLAGAIALPVQCRASQQSVNWLLGPRWGRPSCPSSRARKLLLPEFLQISFWLPRPKLRPGHSHLIRCIACWWWYNWLMYIMRDVM